MRLANSFLPLVWPLNFPGYFIGQNINAAAVRRTMLSFAAKLLRETLYPFGFGLLSSMLR
jgi:hypothetical protein